MRSGPEELLDCIRRTRQQVADNNGFQAAIVEDGGIVGVVGYHSVGWHHRATSIGPGPPGKAR
jgi:ribosomal-protein-serine acetyltransferase